MHPEIPSVADEAWTPHLTAAPFCNQLSEEYLSNQQRALSEETRGDINISLWSPGTTMEEEFRIKPYSFEHANRLRNIVIPRMKS